jgi:hypothetical protein
MDSTHNAAIQNLRTSRAGHIHKPDPNLALSAGWYREVDIATGISWPVLGRGSLSQWAFLGFYLKI